MAELTEPNPIWPDANRLSPNHPFPAYRFVPGLNPHPTGDPKGHSYLKEEEDPHYIPPEKWKENDLYLYGIDLYHQGYLWESHEAWETIWHLTQKEDGEGQFLQGLIQNSAAQLKLHILEMEGASNLSQESLKHLRFVLNSGVCDTHQKFMGIHIPELIKMMEDHYSPLWEEEGVISAPPPHLLPS